MTVGKDRAKSPSWGWLDFCSRSGGPRVLYFCRISCSKCFFFHVRLQYDIWVREGQGRLFFSLKKTVVSMKVVNGAKAKDRISEHDNGEEW